MSATVLIEQLIMSSDGIEQRIAYAGEEKVLRIYISDGGDPIYNNANASAGLSYSRTLEEWQYDYIRHSINKISKYLDLDFLKVDKVNIADYEIVLHQDPQKDSVSGGKSSPDTLMISHQSGSHIAV